MMRSARWLYVWTSLAVAAAGTTVACVQDVGPEEGQSDDQAVREQELVGGTPSTGAPEVGQYNGKCTATLIAPHFVLTAGHCFDSRSLNGKWIGTNMQNTATEGTDQVTFKLENGTPPANERTRRVLRGRSFSGYLAEPSAAGVSTLNKDVALLWLDQDITDINPATLATTLPGSGQTSVIWGYGCTDQVTLMGAGTKRYFGFTYPTVSVGCPGDSGGPARFFTHADNGAIWGVNSRGGVEGPMHWGAVVPLRAKIQQMMTPGGWDGWSEWFPTILGANGNEGNGEASGRSKLTVHTSAPGRVGVYWAKADGSIWGKHTEQTPTAPWQPGALTAAYPVLSAAAASVFPGSRMTVISPSYAATSLYWVTRDGAIRNTYWTGAAWATPFDVAPPNSARVPIYGALYRPGNVAALSTKPNGSSVFWITPSGALRSSWYDPNVGHWVFDQLIFPVTGASPTTQLSALSTRTNHSALYWIGSNGALRTTYFDTVSWSWIAPYDMTAPGEGTAGAKVTAVSTIAGGTTLFWSSPYGVVRTTFRTQSTNWAAPYSLSGASAAIPGSAVEAVSTTYGNVSTYYQSPTNALVTRFYANNAWQPAYQLGDPSLFAASQAFSVVTPWSNGTSLFYADGNGQIMSRFFDPR